MHRTIYPKPLSDNAQLLSQASGQEETHPCQCINVQYNRHWKLFKTLVGIVLIFVAIFSLILTEKKAVLISKSYQHGMQSVITLPMSEPPNPDNDRKLVHISGYLSIPKALEDSPYGVSIYAVKLKRRVQMYQWVEEKISNELAIVGVGSSAGTVRYNKEWRDKLSDSSKFQVPRGHENPRFMPLHSEVRVNPNVYIGHFRLGEDLKEKFRSFVQFTSGERPDSQDIKMHMGLYYHSADVWNPAVGDIRIQFSFAGPSNAHVTIIAMQVGNELRSYESENGVKMAFLHEGKRHHEEILHKEHYPGTVEAWIYRVFSYILVWIGSYFASQAINMLNKRNETVRNFIAMGSDKFSMLLATFMCFSVTGTIWFHFKPIFGVLLLAFTCSLVLYYAITGPDVPKSSKLSLPQYSKVKRDE